MDVLDLLGIQTINSGTSNGSQWLMAIEPKLLASENPTNQTTIAKVQLSNAEQYRQVINTAIKNFQVWRQIPAPKRGELIRQIGLALRAKKAALGALIAMESGKLQQEGEGEVQEMIDMTDFAVGQARMLYGKVIASERPLHRLMEQWHPLGVVGIITAFNFPVAVWAWNAFLAAICGNTVIWKPSHKVPLAAIAVQNICHEVCATHHFPGIFSLFMPASHEIADNFVADQRIPLISFTGSIAVGRRVNQILAARFGRSLLELSGNNAVIVDESADLKLVIPGILFGAIGTAGQRCTTIRRLFIHASRYDEVITHLIKIYKNITVGDPMQSSTLMGPLIDAAAVTHFQNALKEVQQKGGKILYGGSILPGPGHFVEPTLVEASNDWEVVQRETFAPILYVMKYQQLDEAIARNNAVPQGLSSALFTNQLQNAEYFLSAMGSDCGIANINVSTSGAEIGGAFGGEKETGGGREAGSDVWKNYMRRQTNTINYGHEMPLAQGIKFNL